MTSTTSNEFNLLSLNPIKLEKWYGDWREQQIRSGYILVESSDRVLTTWYAEEVVGRRIKASKKVVLACKRHLNDLKRAGTDDFPYVFDEEKALRPIRFNEKYCKPSKGDIKKLVLQPWQHFVMGSLYGWVHRDTGVRRFREGLIFIGRKNGKTTMISGLANYAVSKDKENGARVYVLANSKQQAGELFDESRAMVQSSPQLRKRYRENQKGIFYDKTKSRIEPRASDSKKLDGLNTHLGIFDEIHEFVDYKLINVIKKSRGSRKQPMILYITTAGYQLDGPLVDYYSQADEVLDGAVEDDRTFYFMAELDDENEFDQPEEWIKANPNMGVSLDLPILIGDWKKDKRTPQERSDFIAKQFNFFVNSTQQSFLDYQTIKNNEKSIDMEQLKGKTCIGGFDLSDSEDFTSACLEFPVIETGEVVVLSHTWIPEKKVIEDNEKIPYREYEEMGLLTIIPGEYVKKEYIFNWFVEQSKVYSIQLITYDPAKAFGLVESLKDYGFNTLVVRQGYLTLGPAVDNAKEIFIDGNVIFNKNRLFRWYVNNVKLAEDSNRNKLPQKQSRYRKIDGFAAFINSHTEVMKLLVSKPKGDRVEVISMADLLRG
ncbi:terminase large subunit [Alkalihalophilus lindianensis]|uniref:Terminase large subunit n=2 Tax=Bacillaceae TaxID=186817 RepID=A0ABU3X7D7_9BACI|nr:terminase large subunit [Alkalihalophilus lindianensis]MDV2683810.1 terminase large subunit [Alkalihalophilus lindianensis]MDV2683876.1 terminase large subunit [Alkalihalophilus lindianensis]